MHTCISSHGLKRSWRSCPRRVNAGNKNTPSTHHPRRWNVTTLTVTYAKISPKSGEPQRYSWGTQKKKTKKKNPNWLSYSAPCRNRVQITCIISSAYHVQHVLFAHDCARGHSSVRVGDSLWSCEEIVKISNCAFQCDYYYYYYKYILSYPSRSLADRWGTTVDFTTSFFHSSQFSAQLIFHSRPVRSLMLSSYRFLCLPLRLPPWTVPCRIVLASPDDRVTCPYHFSLRLFTEVRRSWYGSMAFPILAFTSSLVMWSLYEIPRSLRKHLTSNACILLLMSAVMVHVSHAYKSMDMARKRRRTNQRLQYPSTAKRAWNARAM